MSLLGYSVPETLTDDAGNALKAITVVVTGPGAYSGTAVTDGTSGVLRLGPLPVGDYTVSFGARTVTVPVVPTSADIQTAYDLAGAAASAGTVSTAVAGEATARATAVTAALATAASDATTKANAAQAAAISTAAGDATTKAIAAQAAAIAAAASAGSSTYAPIVNVALKYGSTATLINQALTEAAAGAVLFLQAGTYDLDAPLIARSNVTLRGAGKGQTTLRPTGLNPAIQYLTGSDSVRLTDFTLEDLTIDGVNQSGTYTYTAKGVYIMYTSRCTFRRLEIKNAYATGLGLDYPAQKTLVESCVFDTCGRGRGGTPSGGNGLGMLAGTKDFEDCLVIDCWARSCSNYGFLVETPVGLTGKAIGYRFQDCSATSSGTAGFCDAGAQGAIFDGCTAYGNLHGFVVNAGDDGTYPPGTHGRITNCHALYNTGNGIRYDAQTIAPRGDGYTIAGNTVVGNTLVGITALVNNISDVSKLTIRNNEVHRNGGRGIYLSSVGSAKFVDLSLIDNVVGDNGTIGIEIGSGVTGGQVSGNRCFTSSGGPQTSGLKLTAGFTITLVAFDGGDLRESTTPMTVGASLSQCTVGLVPGWTRSTGAPALAAPKGTVYQRADGTAGTLLYVNTDGSTAWTTFA